MGTHFRGPREQVDALDAYIKLMRAADSVSAVLARRLADDGLTMPQFGCLETLLHLGPLCQKELGLKLLRSGANVTTVVDNLERAGLVRRVRGTEDRRFVTVHLTPKGRELISQVFPRHAEATAAAFSALSPAEQQTLSGLCKRLGLHAAAPSAEKPSSI